MDPLNKDSTIKQFRSFQDEIYELFKKKNEDYGDAFKENGSIGTLIRISEKSSRLKNFVTIDANGITYKKNNKHFESIKDTLMDLNSYTLMMLLLLEKEGQSSRMNQNF